ncbi:hypothetical protein TI39_contig5887g00003 [Zymoseptoria brevis]|uniref:Heterokaryon incompatibility domain-containing protein n=1 Tax=Zymoseptoria brevis TaxID=1047168 RepID=A0A0F4G4D8_9PEZI|nr:hypothetical protein TI39_contig5887g00003 [Zymoseptoria brevis]
MRLINTSTLELAEFVGSEIPSYAILSHRWASSSEEPSMKDFLKGLKPNTSGYRKILDFCQLAASEDHKWAWVDTICIDKRSSAELSESINSMYAWYRDAQRCYAFLSDVERSEWELSEWWYRGWTLQELIAPVEVVFYDASWRPIGCKSEMASEIAALTRIPVESLTSPTFDYGALLVAQKMSWASGRKTTRIEDRAYCLLGLFRIHMPLLYGEGAKAFERLQLQILTKYSDDSILAWSPEDESQELATKPSLVLADSPDRFQHCSEYEKASSQYSRPERGAFAPRITPWGMEYRPIAQRLHYRTHPKSSSEQAELWGVLLTAVAGEGLTPLPYVLVLVQCGPLPTHYRRLQCYRSCNITKPHTWLSQNLRFGAVASDKHFYLQYDPDTSSETRDIAPHHVWSKTGVLKRTDLPRNAGAKSVVKTLLDAPESSTRSMTVSFNDSSHRSNLLDRLPLWGFMSEFDVLNHSETSTRPRSIINQPREMDIGLGVRDERVRTRVLTKGYIKKDVSDNHRKHK